MKRCTVLLGLYTILSLPLFPAEELPLLIKEAWGALRLGDQQLALVLSETGNKPTMQAASTIKAEAGYPKDEGGTWELRGRMTVGTSKKNFPFTQTVRQEAGKLTLSWRVDELVSDVIDARIAFRMPGKDYEGKALTLGGKPLALPLEPDTFMVVTEQVAKTLALPLGRKDLLFEGGPFTLFVQDRRKMGNDWFEARVQLAREGASAALTLVLTAIPAGSAVTEKGPSGPPAWERYPKFTVQKDIRYLGPERTEAMDVYVPIAPKGESFSAVLVIHGGGWAGGDKADARERQLAETFARAGFVAASVNYLLASSSNKLYSWPTNVHDLKTAVRYLRANASKFQINPGRMGTIGGSAGGHLSMLLAWTGDDPRLDPPAFPGVSTRIDAVVDLYGVPDIRLPLSKNTRASGEGWTGFKAAENPELFALLSPITHVTNSGAPVFILHGTKDTTVPLAQTEALVKVLDERKARYQLKVVEGAPHTFLLNGPHGDFREAVINFFREYLRP